MSEVIRGETKLQVKTRLRTKQNGDTPTWPLPGGGPSSGAPIKLWPYKCRSCLLRSEWEEKNHINRPQHPGASKVQLLAETSLTSFRGHAGGSRCQFVALQVGVCCLFPARESAVRPVVRELCSATAGVASQKNDTSFKGGSRERESSCDSV